MKFHTLDDDDREALHSVILPRIYDNMSQRTREAFQGHYEMLILDITNNDTSRTNVIDIIGLYKLWMSKETLPDELRPIVNELLDKLELLVKPVN
jgi:hypothetical protein